MGSAAETRDCYDVGVLFVHGIGQQARGDTLVGFGEPLQGWIARWLSESAEESVVEAATLTLAPDDLAAPAHAVLAFRQAADAGQSEERPSGVRWLLAESWWSESFTTPSYADLAAWGFQVMPWIVATHFGTRARRAWQRVAARSWREAGRSVVELLLELGYLALALGVLMPLLTAAVLVVLVLGILPIPRVRRAVAGFQRLVSGTVGDSYILLASPIQRQAILDQVRRDLDWLAPRCRAIAVVAHSQGAAIAHRVLRDRPTDRRTLFISFGSGLNKLSAMEVVRRDLRKKTTALRAPLGIWMAPVGGVLFALAVRWGFLESRAEMGDATGPIFVGVMAVALLGLGVQIAWKNTQPPLADVALGGPVRWLDIYASADPVPAGPLFDPASERAEPPPMTTARVTNGASLFRDHTTYWQSQDDFVARVATEIARLSPGLEMMRRPLDQARLVAGRLRRRWRVRWLQASRLIAIGFAVAIPVVREDDVREYTTPYVGVVEWAVDLLPIGASADFTEFLVGAVEVWIVIGLIYLALYWVWRWWSHTEAQLVYQRLSVPPLAAPFVSYLLALAAACEAGVIVLIGWSDGLPSGLGQAALWVVVAFIGAFIVAMVVLGVVKALEARHIIGPIRRAGGPVVAVSAVVFTLVLLPGIADDQANEVPAFAFYWWLLAGVGVVLGGHLAWGLRPVRLLRARARRRSYSGPVATAVAPGVAGLSPRAFAAAAAQEIGSALAHFTLVAAELDASSAERLVGPVGVYELADAAPGVARNLDHGAAASLLQAAAPLSPVAAIAYAQHDGAGDDALGMLEEHARTGPRRHRRRAAEEVAALQERLGRAPG